MRVSSIMLLVAMMATSANAAKPPANVNIINQPVEVTGEVSAKINDPVTVSGAVDANVSGTVEVVNPDNTPLTVKIDPASQSGISHFGRPLTKHIQLQATSFPIATAARLQASELLASGGGTTFDLDAGECLVITELEIDYINADTSSFPIVSFRLGLTDSDLTIVSGRRTFRSAPDGNDSGAISKTFPSGLVFKTSSLSPERTRLGLETFSARVVDFAATGYIMACE